tara:strand:+ start:360 stop:665 length:306 start_codon:yes stop_codon:yes gene_type:complete
MRINKKTLITVVIIALLVGAAWYFMRGKSSSQLDYAKNVMGLSEEDAQKVVDFADTQILNRTDGETAWLESTAQKAQERGRTTIQQALKEALYHLRKHNKL